MNFDRRKIVAAQKLLATEQEEIIEQVEYLLSTQEKITVTDDQKSMLDEAFESLEKDGRRLHKHVVKETNKRYNKD